MKRMLAFAALAMVLVGCAPTPVQQWYQMGKTLNHVEGTWDDLHDLNVVNDETWMRVYESAIIPAQGAVDRMGERAQAEPFDKAAFDAAKIAAEAKIAKADDMVDTKGGTE